MIVVGLGVAPSDARRPGGVPRSDRRQPARPLLRPRRRRRRPGRLAAAVYGASEGLRTLALDMVAPGGQAGSQFADRELPGLPDRDLGRRPDPAGARAGGEVRRAPQSARARPPALREEAGHLVVRSRRRDRGGRSRRDRRHRRPLPATRCDPPRTTSNAKACTTRPPRWRPAECATSPVVVAGGGNSAGQAAVFLAESGQSGHRRHPRARPEQRACPATSSTGSTPTTRIEVRANTRIIGSRRRRRL